MPEARRRTFRQSRRQKDEKAGHAALLLDFQVDVHIQVRYQATIHPIANLTPPKSGYTHRRCRQRVDQQKAHRQDGGSLGLPLPKVSQHLSRLIRRHLRGGEDASPMPLRDLH